MYSIYVLTVFHEVTELLVSHSAIWSAVIVDHSLNLVPSEIGHTATAHHQPTDELLQCECLAVCTIDRYV